MLELETNIPLFVLIEDTRAYEARLRQELLETAKWIGRLEEWIESRNIAYNLIPRSTVKKWIFDTFPDIARPRIEKEIICRDHKKKDGTYCKPSAKYVNDRVVIAAMKQHWNIETPKPGKTNRFGISKHAWAALGLASYWLSQTQEDCAKGL